MWIPCWRWNDRTFRKAVAYFLTGCPNHPQGLTTSTVPGHCPPLPLRDPVIESNEHCVYFGRASERSRRREYEGRKRQIKDSTNLNISFLKRQQSLLLLLLFHASVLLQNHIQTAGKWPKAFTCIIWDLLHQTQCWFVRASESLC